MEEGFSRPSIQLLPFAFLLLPSSGLRLGRLWERNKHSNNPQSEFLRPLPQIDSFLLHSYFNGLRKEHTKKKLFLVALLFGRNDQLDGWKKAFLAHESNFCLLPFAFLLLPSRGLRLGRLWERNKHSNNPQSEFLRPLPQIDFFLPHSHFNGLQKEHTETKLFLMALLFGRNDQLDGWKKAFLAHESYFCLLPSYFCLQEVCASVVFGSETNIRTIRKANSFVRFLKSTSSFRIPTSMVYGRNTQKRSYFLLALLFGRNDQRDGWKKAFLAHESNFCLLPSYYRRSDFSNILQP